MKVYVGNLRTTIGAGNLVENEFSVRITGEIKGLHDEELDRITNAAYDLHQKSKHDARAYPQSKDYLDR